MRVLIRKEWDSLNWNGDGWEKQDKFGDIKPKYWWNHFAWGKYFSMFIGRIIRTPYPVMLSSFPVPEETNFVLPMKTVITICDVLIMHEDNDSL